MGSDLNHVSPTIVVAGAGAYICKAIDLTPSNGSSRSLRKSPTRTNT